MDVTEVMAMMQTFVDALDCGEYSLNFYGGCGAPNDVTVDVTRKEMTIWTGSA